MKWFSLGEKIGGTVGVVVGAVVGTGIGIVTRGTGFKGIIPAAIAGGSVGAVLGDKIEKFLKEG